MSENSANELKAQEKLTPKQRAESEGRARVLEALNITGLSEEEIRDVRYYSDVAGRLAGREQERLERESPILKIVEAIEQELPYDRSDSSRRLDGIQSIANMPKKWQAAVREEQALASLQGREVSQIEIIELLLNPQTLYNQERFPSDARVFITEQGTDTPKHTQFLRKLGVLPEGADVNTLFKLPDSGLDLRKDIEAIERAIQNGTPTKILDGTRIVGLSSSQLPGVQISVDNYRGRLSTDVRFTPDAVARSIANVQGVKV